MTTPQPWSPPITSTAIRIDEIKSAEKFPRRKTELLACVDRQNLASLVITTGRADPVRHMRLGALRTFADLRQFQHAVISTTHFLPARRRFTFWNAHKFKITVSVCLIQPTRTAWIHLCRQFYGPCQRWLSLIRRNPVCTMDAAETQGEYLPAPAASSPRNRS